MAKGSYLTRHALAMETSLLANLTMEFERGKSAGLAVLINVFIDALFYLS
jgi:hypothetical protein